MTGGMHQRAVTSDELDQIVERLHTTATKSLGRPCKYPAPVLKNVIARPPLPVEGQIEICRRLYSTPTKASSGATRCKSADPLKPPGLGLKMLPVIDGLEERFKGKARSKAADGDAPSTRLHRAQTASGKARGDFPRILLWPERTLVGGNTQRVREYHESGTIYKQAVLARRDKWFI